MIIDSNVVINIELPRRRGLHYSHHKEEMVIMEGDRGVSECYSGSHARNIYIYQAKCCVLKLYKVICQIYFNF